MRRDQQTQADKEPTWVKTQFSNLVRHAPSGGFYARLRVKGKLIWRSLKTKRISVAQLKLADLEREERKKADAGEKVESGLGSVGDALQLLVERIKGQPNLKPRTKSYYEERVTALKKSWPGLGARHVKDVTKDECLKWAGSFASRSSPVAYNHTASVLKRAFGLAVECGARLDNPAASVEWVKERHKELKLPEPDQFERLVREIETAGGRFSPHCADLVRFLAFGGFRLGEARNVTWADCDFQRGKIMVRGDPETGTKNSEIR